LLLVPVEVESEIEDELINPSGLELPDLPDNIGRVSRHEEAFKVLGSAELTGGRLDPARTAFGAAGQSRHIDAVKRALPVFVDENDGDRPPSNRPSRFRCQFSEQAEPVVDGRHGKPPRQPSVAVRDRSPY